MTLITDPIQISSFVHDRTSRILSDDALDGLTRPFKEISSRYLYDDHGSELFERITLLPEYYPTGAERSILEMYAGEIVEQTDADELVELGSGAAVKTRLLLDAMENAGSLHRYIPFDIAEQTVRDSAVDLSTAYPGLQIHGILGDFEHQLDVIPAAADDHTRLVAFLGGTIGNFTPGSRRHFFRKSRDLLGDSGFLLLGTDLVKDIDVLERAYNDGAGVTAAFNLNVLNVLNRELDANFPVDLFEHVAFFDQENEWIEMRLRARRACRVTLRAIDLEIKFDRGEEIRTEISSKFTQERLRRDFAACGLEMVGWFTDPRNMFALSLARSANFA